MTDYRKVKLADFYWGKRHQFKQFSDPDRIGVKTAEIERKQNGAKRQIIHY
jgi:hypothetical protein